MFGGSVHNHRGGPSSRDTTVDDCDSIWSQPSFPISSRSLKSSCIESSLDDIEDERTCSHIDARVKVQVDGHSLSVDVRIECGKINPKTIWNGSKPPGKIVGDALHRHYEVGTGARLFSINLCDALLK
jgi:hypothetical protein